MIEELIQEEIIDETDVFVDIHQRIQVARAKKARLNVRKQFLLIPVSFFTELILPFYKKLCLIYPLK